MLGIHLTCEGWIENYVLFLPSRAIASSTLCCSPTASESEINVPRCINGDECKIRFRRGHSAQIKGERASSFGAMSMSMCAEALHMPICETTKKRIEWYNLFSSIKSNKIPEEYWKMCACMRGAWMFTPHGNLRTLHWAAERRNFMTTQFRQIYCILLSLWTHIFFYDLLTDSWCGLSDDFIITYFFVRPLCCWRHEFWQGEWWSMQQRWIKRKKCSASSVCGFRFMHFVP